MRVLHYTRDFPPRINGGLSTAVGGLVTALRAAGVDAHVVSFDAWRPRHNGRATPPEPPRDGVIRLRVPAQLPFVAEHVVRLSPDLVHVHDPRLFGVLPVACPRVFSVHVAQGALRRLRGLEQPTLGEIAEQEALARADAVVCPSNFTRSQLGVGQLGVGQLGVGQLGVGQLGSGQTDVGRVLPLGVALGPPPVPPPEAPVMLFVGRFADIKGLAELIDAFPRVREAVPGATLRLAGGLPDSRGSERRWRRRLQATGVEWLGWLTPEALRQAMDAASVVVAPSWTESYGSAVVEAMARGRPVVAAEAGALPERFEHGKSGWLVPARDSKGLADGLIRLLRDRDLRRAMGEAARRRAELEAWPRRVSGYLALYREFGA